MSAALRCLYVDLPHSDLLENDSFDYCASQDPVSFKKVSKVDKEDERDSMDNSITFTNRNEFRDWLQEYGVSSEGVWLLIGKAGGPKTIKAHEALEEALCFGWIDGVMQKD